MAIVLMGYFVHASSSRSLFSFDESDTSSAEIDEFESEFEEDGQNMEKISEKKKKVIEAVKTEVEAAKQWLAPKVVTDTGEVYANYILKLSDAKDQYVKSASNEYKEADPKKPISGKKTIV